jgi:hypothetical protein
MSATATVHDPRAGNQLEREQRDRDRAAENPFHL